MKQTKKNINEKQGSSKKIKGSAGRSPVPNKSSGDIKKDNTEKVERAEKTERQEKTDRAEKKLKDTLRDTGTSQFKKSANTTMNSAIPRNFNEYRHLIHGLFSTENDIDWVLKLRAEDGSLKEKLENFYGKFLEGGVPHKSIIDIADTTTEKFRYDHLIRRRIGPTVSAGQVNFEVGLRAYSAKDGKLRDREKAWSGIPVKIKNDIPQFLPPLKEEMKIRKQMKENPKLKIPMVSGLEGHLNYPKFKEKVPSTNFNEVKHLCRPGTEMPQVLWQLSLR